MLRAKPLVRSGLNRRVEDHGCSPRDVEYVEALGGGTQEGRERTSTCSVRVWQPPLEKISKVHVS